MPRFARTRAAMPCIGTAGRLGLRFPRLRASCGARCRGDRSALSRPRLFVDLACPARICSTTFSYRSPTVGTAATSRPLQASMRDLPLRRASGVRAPHLDSAPPATRSHAIVGTRAHPLRHVIYAPQPRDDGRSRRSSFLPRPGASADPEISRLCRQAACSLRGEAARTTRVIDTFWRRTTPPASARNFQGASSPSKEVPSPSPTALSLAICLGIWTFLGV